MIIFLEGVPATTLPFPKVLPLFVKQPVAVRDVVAECKQPPP